MHKSQGKCDLCELLNWYNQFKFYSLDSYIRTQIIIPLHSNLYFRFFFTLNIFCCWRTIRHSFPQSFWKRYHLTTGSDLAAGYDLYSSGDYFIKRPRSHFSRLWHLGIYPSACLTHRLDCSFWMLWMRCSKERFVSQIRHSHRRRRHEYSV